MAELQRCAFIDIGTRAYLVAWSLSEGRFYLAVILTAVSPVGFVISLVGRTIFGGTLSDSNGIPPVRLTIFGADLSVDLNFAAIIAALLSLGVILTIY
jgi:hypothetical protein